MTESSSPVLSRRDGPILTLTLNRPDRLNAVSLPLYERLLDELDSVEEGDGVRVVVLTGAGRAFCVGADLKAHGEGRAAEEVRRTYVRTAQEVNRRIQTLAVPVVAAVNGHAIGAGLELSLSADVAVVAERAKLRLPEVALGTFVGGGLTYRLVERVGDMKARELVMFGRFFRGEDAADMGLLNEAAPTGEVMARARELAGELAARAPISMRLAKELLHRAPRMERAEALEAEARALLRCMETEDWEEGIRAFEEDRPPRFQGR